MRSLLPLAAIAAAVITAPAVLAQKPAPTSGFDVASFDTSVRPQDDLYRYVNGRWIDRTTLPPDRPVTTVAVELADAVESDLRAIIEGLVAAGPHKRGSAAQQISDLYRSMMDEARLEALGLEPIRAELAAIDAISDTAALAVQVGHLSATSTAGPFFGAVSAQASDPSARIVKLSQGGILMPIRDYYLASDDQSVRIRREYVKYLSRIFELAGRPSARTDAAAVLALETTLAALHWSVADSRDVAKTENPYSLDAMMREMPGFDWMGWARPQGLQKAKAIVVAQPSFFRGFSALVPDTPLATWRAWLAARYLTAMAPFLNDAIGEARFELFGRVLAGQQAPRPRWKRAVALVNAQLPDPLGRLYVERHFPSSSRQRVRAIVNRLVTAYGESIRELAWMSPATKSAALKKLSRLSIEIGYPDVWRDSRGFVIAADDLVGNLRRAQEFQARYQLSRLSRATARGEWLMPPQTVNAYYSPPQNEIVFPAAILQPPYFDASADDAVNYGAIGAAIGHEITHALDDRGRWNGPSGLPTDWWDETDESRYREQTRGLVNQFDDYRTVDGAAVNGRRTFSENIGDLSGLSVAFRAYKASLKGRPSSVLDGLTGEQRFFLAWVRIWRTKATPEYRRQVIMMSAYAPAAFRANGPLAHIDGFYAAFNVRPQDRLYREPKRRIHVF